MPPKESPPSSSSEKPISLDQSPFNVSASYLTLILPKDLLAKKTYHYWTSLMESSLEHLKLIGLVDGTDKCPTLTGKEATADEKAKIKEWKHRDSFLVIILKCTIDSEVFGQVTDFSSARAIRKSLAVVCGARGTMGTLAWFCMLANVHYGETTEMSTHIATMRKYYQQLKLSNFDLPDHLLSAFVINSLSESFDSFVSTFSNTVKLASNDVIKRLLDNEQMRKTRKSTNVDSALIASGCNPARLCTNCKRPNHTIKKCWAKGGGAEGQQPEHLTVK